MIILSIDSSTPVAGAAVLDEDKLLGESMLNTKNTHSEKLLVMVDTLLRELGLDMTDIDVIAAAHGPGSFTGLRIGMATAKGLAQGGGKKLIAVPTLDALAHRMAGVSGLICPILHAKRDEVYTAAYRSMAGGRLERLSGYQAVKPETLLDELAKQPEKVCFLGDGVAVYQALLQEKLGDQMWLAPMDCRLPSAASIGVLAMERALRGEYDDLYGCGLIYIRRSEAEIQWEIKHGQKITD